MVIKHLPLDVIHVTDTDEAYGAYDVVGKKALNEADQTNNKSNNVNQRNNSSTYS